MDCKIRIQVCIMLYYGNHCIATSAHHIYTSMGFFRLESSNSNLPEHVQKISTENFCQKGLLLSCNANCSGCLVRCTFCVSIKAMFVYRELTLYLVTNKFNFYKLPHLVSTQDYYTLYIFLL